MHPCLDSWVSSTGCRMLSAKKEFRKPSLPPPPPHTRYGDKNPVGISGLRFPWWLHSAALPIGWVSCSGFSNRGSDTRLLPDWPGWCCSAMATGAEGPVSAEQLESLSTWGGAEIQRAACRGCKLEQVAPPQLKVRRVSSWSPRALGGC